MAQGGSSNEMMELSAGEASSTSSSAQGTYFLGRYRVVDEIGVGGMASVHLARMDGAGGFQKWVAIKKIHPHLTEDEQFINMFLDEARIAARISHPNVAQVFELGKQDNTFWIAMEYLHGEPLREMMRYAEEVGAPMAPELAARVIADAAEGLHAAHELRGKDGESLNLVHRDVTPHNLFLTYEGMVKVVDFGIAKVSGRLSSTRAGTLKGKLAYMSPEQVRGDEIDRRTDIFALGVVLWELTVGQRLFRMESDLETLEKVQACIVPPPSSIRPDFPAELESIVMKALQKRTDTRYQTARELSRALQQYLMHSGNFIGHEEVAAYVTQVFGDRIRKREAHLRWAAEVTQTISLDAVRQHETSGGGVEEISVVSYDDDPSYGSETAAASPLGARAGAARPQEQDFAPPTARGPTVSQGAITTAAPRAQAAPKPQLPPAHGIHLPAPRVPQSVAAQPAKSVMISATPPSAPGYPAPAPLEEDEDEEIATVVVPSRLALEQGHGGPFPAAGAPAPVPAAGMPAPSQQPYVPRNVKQTMLGGFGAGAGVQGYPQPPSMQQPPPMAAAQPPQHAGPTSNQQTMPPNRVQSPYYQPPAQPADPAQQAFPPPAGGFVPPGVNAGVIPGPQYPGLPGYAAPGEVPRRIADETVQIAAARSNRMVYIAAGAATFLVVIGVFAVLLLRGMLPGPSPEPAPSQTAAVPSVVTPSATAPMTAAAPTQSAPPAATATTTATAASTAAPTTAKTAKTSATQPATGGVPTGATPTAKPPAGGGEPGFLTVVCTPFCDSVVASGRNLGPSPVVRVPLPPGQYSVILRRTGGATKVIPVTIVSGQVASQRVPMN